MHYFIGQLLRAINHCSLVTNITRYCLIVKSVLNLRVPLDAVNEMGSCETEDGIETACVFVVSGINCGSPFVGGGYVTSLTDTYYGSVATVQ